MIICKNCGYIHTNENSVCCDTPQLLETDKLTQKMFDEVDEIKSTRKDLDTKEKALTNKFKDIYSELGIKSVVVGTRKFSMSVSTPSTLDEPGLRQHLKDTLTGEQLEQYKVINVTESLNPDALKELMKDGIVSGNVIASFTKEGKPVKKFLVGEAKVKEEA